MNGDEEKISIIALIIARWRGLNDRIRNGVPVLAFFCASFLLLLLMPNSPYVPPETEATEENGIVSGEASVIQAADRVVVPIIMYHDVSFATADSISPDRLAAQIESLKKSGFTPIFFEDLVKFVRGEEDLPFRPVILSFDDGYLDNFEQGFPIIREHGAKAEIAVVGWSIGRHDYPDTGERIYSHFSWPQAKLMCDSGCIRIESHTSELHIYRKNGNPERTGVLRESDVETEEVYRELFSDDISRSASAIREHTDTACTALVYPYGRYDALTEELLDELEIPVSVTTKPGVNLIERGNEKSLRTLKRIDGALCKQDIGQYLMSWVINYPNKPEPLPLD